MIFYKATLRWVKRSGKGKKLNCALSIDSKVIILTLRKFKCIKCFIMINHYFP